MLETAGVALAGALGSVPVVTASGTASGEPSAKSEGISEAVQNLLAQGKTRQAERLLKKHDVPYDGRTSTPSDASVSTADAIAPGMIVESESTFSIYSWYDHENWEGNAVYRTSYNWTVSPDAEVECLGNHPPDGIAVTFEGAMWAFDGNTDPGPYVFNLDDTRYGVKAKYDSDRQLKEKSGYRPDISSSLQFDMEKRKSGSHRIYADYAHTWKNESFFGTNCVTGLKVGFSVGGPVAGISVSWENGTGHEWVHSLDSIEV